MNRPGEQTQGPARDAAWRMHHRGRSLLVLLVLAACSRAAPSRPPLAVETVATEPVVVPEIAAPPASADEVAAVPVEEETLPEEQAALRAWLATHPQEVPGVTTLDDVSLVLLRGEAAATVCVVVDSTERCYRTSTAVHAARLMVPEEDDFERESPVRAWLKLDGAIYRVDAEGALQPGGRPPRGFWAKLGVSRGQGSRRGALTLQEVPAEDVPIAALVEVEPEVSRSPAGVVLTADEFLCVQLDDLWRCAASPFAERRGDARPRLFAAVRGPSGVFLPIEVEDCASGSELTDCIRSLHLFAVVGPGLREVARLPIGAEIDERVRDRDGWIAGTLETYRRCYTVETPTCVRLTATERTHEAYSVRFRDHGKRRNTRRKLPLTKIPADSANELPRLMELDAYMVPTDLGGLWQLRGERWLRVDACDP